MNATGFDANAIEEGWELLEWLRSGGVGLISSLGVYRAAQIAYPIAQTRERLAAAVAGRYSQLWDPWRPIRSLHWQLSQVVQEFERWRPFWEELRAALHAYYEGNEDVFLAWVEKYVQRAPDGLLLWRQGGG
jgi:hypothetical protein